MTTLETTRDTMRSFGILLLATAVLAAPTKNDDPKNKNKRHLLLDNFGVSSYSIPYSLTGYPYGLFGFSTRVFGAQVPLSNSLVFAYPYGLGYEDLLYRGHFGDIISPNELALAAAFAQSTRFVSDVSAYPSILNLQVEQGKAVNVQVPSSKPVKQSKPDETKVTTVKPSDEDTTFHITCAGLTDETTVSGGIESFVK